VHPARDLHATTPADVGIPFERVTMRTSDGFDLVGWWMPASGAPKGTVVFLHGYGESKNQSLGFVAPILHNASYHVLAFDFRAHGESSGDHTSVGLDEIVDVRSAIAYVADRTGDADHTALMGFSMGAATAINAADGGPPLRAIVSDSSFATLENIASHSITHFTNLPKYPFGPLAVLFAGWIIHRDIALNRPIDHVGRIDTPVLVIQGGADDIAYPDTDGRALYDRCANELARSGALARRCEWWLVPDARHVRAHDHEPEAYVAHVVGFLDQWVPAGR
jgi:pimeloyl-ACP methyl ester carboxylesterase